MLLQEKVKTAEDMAYTDLTTELPNERALNKTLNDAVIQKSHTFAGLTLFQILGLEEISYFVGEVSKNKILKIIKDQIYSIIEKEKSTLFILSADKYIITNLYKNDTDIFEINEQLSKLSQDLITRLTRSISQDWGNINLNISIGLNIVNFSDNHEVYDMIKNTKTALEFAKKSGENSASFFSKEVSSGLKRIIQSDLQKHISPASDPKLIKRQEAVNYSNIFEVKVFFLYPHSVIQDGLIAELINQEYEIYSVHDHDKLYKYLEMYNQSIVFINIDEKLSENEWEEYVKKIKNNPLTRNVRIGILSFYAQDNTTERFLIKLMVECGFVKLKAGIAESKDIILRTLAANEAKGKRKYIRVKTDGMENIYFSIKGDYNIKKGKILDISSVGMACYFDDEDILFREGTDFKELQLCLRGVICIVDATITHHRTFQNGKSMYVVMFNSDKYSKFQDKVHQFIYKSLQDSLAKDFSLIGDI